MRCEICGLDEVDVDLVVEDLFEVFVPMPGGTYHCTGCVDLAEVARTATPNVRADSRRRRDETGAATLWVVFITTAVLAVGGLVIDGGYTLSAKRESARVAVQAARVAADQLDTDSLRTGGSDLRAGAAVAAGRDYLSTAGVRGSVAVNGDEVSVTVTQRTKTVILSAFGASGYTVSATATATSIGDNDDGP